MMSLWKPSIGGVEGGLINFVPPEGGGGAYYRAYLRGGLRGFIVFSQKKWCGVNTVVNFKDFSGHNKEIKYFSRTLTEFKDFQDDYIVL